MYSEFNLINKRFNSNFVDKLKKYFLKKSNFSIYSHHSIKILNTFAIQYYCYYNYW